MNDSFLIHAACVQMSCLPGNPDENTRKMVAYIRRIKEERPDTDLIVFPECAVTGYECEECYERCAETLRDGTHVTTLCAAARENAVLLVFGYVENPNGRIRPNCSTALFWLSGTGRLPANTGNRTWCQAWKSEGSLQAAHIRFLKPPSGK